MRHTLLNIFLYISIGLGCVDDVAVELWGECYNIETTTTLELSQSGLTGEIPPEIEQLVNLTYLNLYANELTGEIPPEIGSLTNLTYLDLQMNQLTGQIPDEIGNLVNLIFLQLNENNLIGGIPENICDLTIDWSGIWSDYYQIPYFNIDNNELCPPYPECLTDLNIGQQDTSECEIQEPGDICILDSDEYGFLDCELCCWDTGLLSWLGDDYCDMWGGCAWEGPQFNCEELSYDCGDCNQEWDGSNLSGLCYENCLWLGDINNDEYINIFDITVLIQCLLQNDFLNCNNNCSDVNTDNVINVLDVIAIVNIILDA